MFLIIFIIISVFALALWLYWLRQISTLGKEKKIKSRGILKFCLGDLLNLRQKLLIKKWVLSTFLISLIGCIWVAYWTWATDYSFLMGIFPIVWLYGLIRTLFWEKSDLLENL